MPRLSKNPKNVYEVREGKVQPTDWMRVYPIYDDMVDGFEKVGRGHARDFPLVSSYHRILRPYRKDRMPKHKKKQYWD